MEIHFWRAKSQALLAEKEQLHQQLLSEQAGRTNHAVGVGVPRSIWDVKILSYCWWKKSCTTWNVQTPLNKGITYISESINWCRISSINSSVIDWDFVFLVPISCRIIIQESSFKQLSNNIEIIWHRHIPTISNQLILFVAKDCAHIWAIKKSLVV